MATFNTISLNASGTGDYATIDAAMRFIRDSGNPSETNFYIVNLADGTYNEFFSSAPYTHLVGNVTNPENVIINTDGANNSTSCPSDYPFIPERGQAFNTIPSAFRHGIWVDGASFVCKGVSFESNNCKYPMHHDTSSNGGTLSYFQDCRFIAAADSDGVSAVGIGIYNGQRIIFNRCYFEHLTTGSRRVFFAHNTATEANPCEIRMSSCTFKGYEMWRFNDLDSGQNDSFIIENPTYIGEGGTVRGVFDTDIDEQNIKLYEIGGTYDSVISVAGNKTPVRTSTPVGNSRTMYITQ